ncbi:MAG: glycohydrolase toxin TNT-related protein [Paludibacteraceae bacterium]|nr:glycohydrolase toxin TNT-related protein [Paludibacteraceae bacterium]
MDMSRGRLIYVKDGSGATALTYGSMGEVVRTVRRIIVNPDPENLQTHTFVSESEYDSWGRIFSMTYPDGEKVTYGYHSGTGELASVKNGDNNEFNRLIYASGKGSGIIDKDRSAFGKCAIEYKNSEHPHVVSGIDGVPDVIPRTDLNITYTDFCKVESMEEGDNRYSITYGTDQDRIKSVLRTKAGETTRYYLADYEEVVTPLGKTEKYHYLCGGAVMVERDGEWSLYYCYGDRLGSVVAVTDKNGNVLERYAYTPWGERRDPADWTKADGRTEFLLNRGFTGHEHIDAFGLIDMGGRVYDPVLGMFLSVDPFIQAPDNWLNYNRYLYCLGNPLIYVDPSGEIATALVVSIVVGVVVGTAVGTYCGYKAGATGWKLAAYAGIGLVAGVASGCVGYGVGAALAGTALAGTFMGGMVIGAASGFTGGFITGVGNSLLEGKKFGESLLQGLKDGGIGAAIGAVVGGVSQGVSNVCEGRNFFTGIPKFTPTQAAASATKAAAGEMSLDEYKDLVTKNPGVANANSQASSASANPGATQTSQSLPVKYYPENNGSCIPEEPIILKKGSIIIRYGKEAGSYFTDPGTKACNLSLPETNTSLQHCFQVNEDIVVYKGIASPAFGQPGGGIQYRLSDSFQDLKRWGIITKLNK